MRIEEINLQAFGPFTDRSFSFSSKDGLVVLYGPNEAGKSSMLRALKAWLYGIPTQSTDNFIHDHQKMRIAGKLRHGNGQELAFARRKGNKKTILDPSGNPLDDDALSIFLSSIGGDAFSKMFGIDNDALVKGGQEILEDRGDAGQALFAAGMSGMQLRQLLQSVEKQANELFKSGGSKQEITEALKALNEARRKIREDCVSGKEMAELEHQQLEARTSVSKLDASLADALTEQSRLDRLSMALPKLARRAELLTRLKTMQDAPLLSEDFSQRRREAQSEIKRANEVMAVDAPELQRLALEMEALSDAGAFAPYTDKIESLLKRLGAHQKAQRDLVGLETKHDARVQETTRLLSEIRPGLRIEELDALRLTEARKKRIKELSLRRENAFNAEIKSNDALTLAKDKLTEARRKLDATPKSFDGSDLERIVDALQKHGDLAEAERTAKLQHQEFADDANTALARLGLWSGSLDELERLPVLTSETIGRFQTDFDELIAGEKAVEKRLHDLNEERAAIESDIERIKQKGAIPTEGELGESRSKRDDLWRRIRGAWLEREHLEEPAGMIARNYEEEVKTADGVADTMRNNADQVAEQTERTRRLDSVQKKLEHETAESESLAKRREQFNVDWREAWLDCGVVPLPPREMLAWINRHAKLLELIKRMRSADRDEQETKIKLTAGIDSINKCLHVLAEPQCGEDEPYGMLIGRCKKIISNMRDINNARIALENSVGELEKECRRAEKDLAQSHIAREQWQNEWAECMKWLELSPDASINEADSHLELLDKLFTRAEDAADLADRIAGIRQDADGLDSEVRALVDAIAPNLKNKSAPEAIEELQRLSGKDRDALTLLREDRKRQEEAQRRINVAKAALAEANRSLLQLCREAGCSDPEMLDPIEQKSAERRGLMREIERIEETLQEISKGMALEKLVEEASGVDGDALPALSNSIKVRITTLSAERDREILNTGQIGEKIDALRKRSGAAEAAETAQEHLALIEEKALQYIKLKLASIMLRAEIKKYQAINQGSLTKRAGELFARLTLGSFAGLCVDYNEKDEPYLRGLRPNEESVSVEGMSEGTRDQLYLSLRLATLEKFLEKSEPMPFIVDDILIRFDDKRAKATLMVLAELAEKTQVLFFTHHSRLFEFAESSEMSGKIRAISINN
jgi:uncharacterized protein YhaN